jgi:hypothetical protein
LKKSPTGPAFKDGPLKNKSAVISKNKEFIADNSVNRLVCLRWFSKTQRKENFSRGVGTTPENPAETLTVVRLRRNAALLFLAFSDS